jgi:putative tryptophan/tyrosine transport system substrate-binding protein
MELPAVTKAARSLKGIPINESALRDVEAAAIGQQVLVFEAATGRGIDEAFESLAREKVDALFVTGGGFFGTRRVQLAVLAARYAVPASYSGRAFVEAGGLMSYGTNYADMCRQVGLCCRPRLGTQVNGPNGVILY